MDAHQQISYAVDSLADAIQALERQLAQQR